MTSIRTAAVPGGQLTYTEAGAPGAPLLVLLHGWPQTRRCWDRLIPLAADTHRVIALDLPGIGDSAGVRTDGTKHQIAAVLHEALTNLGATDAVLVGHDIGGMIAYDYVHHYDDASCAATHLRPHLRQMKISLSGSCQTPSTTSQKKTPTAPGKRSLGSSAQDERLFVDTL